MTNAKCRLLSSLAAASSTWSLHDRLWREAGKANFAYRKLYDVRTALTLLEHGVTEFATCSNPAKSEQSNPGGLRSVVADLLELIQIQGRANFFQFNHGADGAAPSGMDGFANW